MSAPKRQRSQEATGVVQLSEEEQRRRVTAVLSECSKEAILDLCLTLLKDPTTLPIAAAFLKLPAPDAAPQKCLICNAVFTFPTGCTVEHVATERYERTSGCEGCGLARCSSDNCVRCGATSCEQVGFVEQYCYAGLHVAKKSDVPQTVLQWNQVEGDETGRWR